MHPQQRSLLLWPSIRVIVCLLLSIACWTAVSYSLINRFTYDHRQVRQASRDISSDEFVVEEDDYEGLEKLLQDLEA